MQIAKAHEIIKGLDAPQKERFDRYVDNLAKDKFNEFFDDKVVDLIMEYARNRDELRGIKKYLKKLGYTQSKYEYAKIKQQLELFAKPSHSYFGWNKNYIQAKAMLIKEVSSWHLEPLKYRGNNSTLEALPRLDTHAGFSYILTGLKYKGEYSDNVYAEYVRREDQARREGSFNAPILIGSRTQASGAFHDDGSPTHTFKCKSRLVSMEDVFLILAESKYARPFQHALGQTRWYAGGESDAGIAGRLGQLRGRHTDYISIDYSSFDQTISDWLIKDAFDIVEAAFKSVSVDQELFSIIKRDFICKCFIDGNGNIVSATKGVPSGSMFTQIIDSLVNRLVVTTYLLHLGLDPLYFDMMIMGDDNIIFTNTRLDKQDLASYVSKNFGLIVHPDKCSQESTKTDPKFLSRTWTVNGQWRSVHELFAKIAYPERFRDYMRGYQGPALVHSYIRTFRLGMEQLMDVERFNNDYPSKSFQHSEAKWLSGLMRYKLYYST